MSVTRAILGLAAASLLLSGCGEEFEGDDEGVAHPTPSAGGSVEAGFGDLGHVNAEFQPYAPDADAVTYDEQAVPPGSTVTAAATMDGAETDFTLAVSGLQPNEPYGAHLHTDSCGEDPQAAGPHYQDDQAPADAANDPEYANEENEVWLDFTTDADGTADSEADVGWTPREGEANSIVIHADHTETTPGEAGMAGTRLACVDFAP
ncbi:superoxide dismutase family protein [Streptomonospora litoralis]|uniref:Copper/zinc superoxide dismutase (SODC) n=1 Tax=Streptomonospora litoralis TaxID=2498135 RepID=A0A4P6Q0A2_9ACTN|nr:superoxide dismutase family protein [Streptomonospora litoralis]QBI52104.1 Copper/zinc superoxide dismutase (SODC) [Streptomonospora litoralis]